MPIAPTYPGVYIEEIPSGVRTISGVATSVTAFIGRALRGPVDQPVTVNSFGDFERLFGGLWAGSMMSYAVRDFFLNGGGQAVIVRVASGSGAARIALPTGAASPDNNLLLEAASPGAWGAGLSASVDHQTGDPMNPSAPADPELFNLTVSEAGGPTEKFLGVSLNPDSSNFLPRVLEKSSSLARVPRDLAGEWIVPDADERPLETLMATSPFDPDPVEATGGDDGADIDADQIVGGAGDTFETDKRGLYSLERADIFNLLCIPPFVRGGNVSSAIWQAAAAYCVKRRAMLIVDPPAEWGTSATPAAAAIAGLAGDIGISGTNARNAALYFPRVVEADPARDRQLDTFVPSGIVAGVMARTDAQRGVWKAPAGLDASLNGIAGLQVNLNDQENGQLNPLGVNCLRSFPVNGRVVWGARTLRGADQLGDEYKYVPVRRLALYIEESLYRGTQWVVFEPNDEPLWAQIRLNVGAFMHNLFRQGAFQGKSPKEAYLVKCDKETTTQNDINLGVVNVLVGFAPLKPAEFVIIRIQQLAGQVEA
jgi:phage tail sheath protein FI